MVLVLTAVMSASAAEVGRRPNILFICTDQQRIEDMSATGNPYVKTPAMDALAARGVRFTHSFCAFPLCSPSRATHVTSRMPYEVGVNTNSLRLPEGLPSMGTLFSATGYRTIWTGKWHLPSSYPTEQEIPGFEYLNEPADKGRKQKVAIVDAGGEVGDGGRGSQADPQAVAAALKFLRTKPKEPFLLSLSLLNPHDICSFTEKTPAKLNLPTDLSKLPPLPANVNAPDMRPQSGGTKPAVPAKKQNSGLAWSDLTWRQQLYYYYRLTEEVDGLIGRVLDALRKAGLEENTIVLFTSDHGEMGGAHRRIRKMALYEEAMGVPFIVAGPGIARGVVDRTHLVSGLDILPTLCDYAGVATAAQTRGLSVRPIIDNASAPWREVVFGALGDSGGRMARTLRYKYNLYDGNMEELFDLQADPGEMKNLVGDAALATVLAQHRQWLREWMQKTGDAFGKPGATPARRGGKRKEE